MVAVSTGEERQHGMTYRGRKAAALALVDGTAALLQPVGGGRGDVSVGDRYRN
jgi:hypothetical protein